MKIAACFSRGPLDSVSTVRRMLKAQCLDDNQAGKVLDLGCGAIGWIQSADRFSSIPRVYRSGSDHVLALSGVPFRLSGGELENRLREATDGGAAMVLPELRQLEGVFAALFWDAPAKRLHIHTDFLGLEPLYFYRLPDLLLLASEQAGIAASGRLSIEADPAGWGAFVGFGSTLANSTQLKGVLRVDPGSLWSFDPRSDRLDRRTYWSWPSPNARVTRSRIDLDELLGLLDREIHGYLRHCSDTTLLLSGGVDSRFLLALLHRNGIRPHALVARHDDELLGADSRFALQLARRYCSGLSQVSPPRDFFSSPAYLQYLQMTGGGTHSLYLFITVLSHFIGDSRPALWDGLFPNVTLFPPDFRARTLREYVKRVCAPAESPRWRGAGLAFDRRLADEMYNSFQQAIHEQTAAYADDEYGIHEFYVRNRTRNRVSLNPHRVYANRSLPYTPGVSRPFWSLIVPVPHAEKSGHALYHDIFLRYFPDMMRVPLCTRGRIVSSNRDSLRNRLFCWTATFLSHYYVRRAAGRLGLRRGEWWESSRLVDKVVARIDPGHPELHADGVRRLQRTLPQPDSAEAEGRQWLFYWQVWRWLMEGELARAGEWLFGGVSEPSGPRSAPAATGQSAHFGV